MSPHHLTFSLAASVVAGLAVALSTASAADAKPPTRIDAEYWGVDCVISAGDETVVLYGGGDTRTGEGGIGAFIERDGRVVAESDAAPASYGDSVDVVIPLHGEDGPRTLALDAELATDGDPVVTAVDERSGNAWTRGTMTETPLAVTGAATLDGVALDASDACWGLLTGYDVFSTNPAHWVQHDTSFGTGVCDVAGMADTQVLVSGSWPDAYVELVVDHGDGQADKAAGDVLLHGGTGRLDTVLADYWTGEPVTDVTVEVQAVRTGGGPEREVSLGDGYSERVSITSYAVTVSVTTADGRHGSTTCDGYLVSTATKVAASAA